MELTEKFFAEMAGWRAMKEARGILASARVLHSHWEPPLLQGEVSAGQVRYRSGLIIHSERDIENICTCRESRQWGKICCHSVAVGLHVLQPKKELAVPTTASSPRSLGPASVTAIEEESGPDKPRAVSWLKRTVDGEADASLELRLVFPPNLAASLAKGRLMIYWQATVDGRTTPLDAVAKSPVYAVSMADAQVLDLVEEWTGGDVPGVSQLGLSQFLQLLPNLVGHPRITLGRQAEMRVLEEPWAPPMRVHLKKSGEIVLEQKTAAAEAEPDWIGPGWVLRADAFQPLGLSVSMAKLSGGRAVISRAEIPQFLHQDWPALTAARAVEADFVLEDFSLLTDQPEIRLQLSGGMAMLDARLECAYGDDRIRPGDAARPLILPDAKDVMKYRVRHFAAEQEAVGVLTRAGFKGPDAHGVWALRGEDNVLSFFAGIFPGLRRVWSVTLSERLQASTQKNLEWVEPSFEVSSSGMQWFDLNVTYQGSAGRVVASEDVQRLLRSGRNHAKRSDGKALLMDVGAMHEFEEVMRDCAPRQEDGRFRFDPAQAGFLQNSLQDQGWSLRGPEAWRRMVDRQTGRGKPACPPLGALNDVLRPYQKEGVAWMHFLAEHQFGGILADEMGLGKTLQTLAFLQCRRDARAVASRLSEPCLVVCPASLVENWAAEARQFTPDLRILVWQGPERHRQAEALATSDLIITSYGLLRRDEAHFLTMDFDTVILDEAQHIKNRQTQNARAVKAVRSRHRFVLTGTPMENSVLDLWSIFDFLMPGYLGSARDFRERYEVPITRDRCAQSQARLARRLRPFLLRRLKRDVARELPEKLVQIAYCEMTEGQRLLYQQILQGSREELFAASSQPGQSPNRLAVLHALLRLRQVSCDPRLLPLPGKTDAMGSGKMDLFAELLDEVLDGGHRALVFSQFVSMLSLIREHLEARNIAYCYLDGATRERAKEIDLFQKDPSVPVFLISLKAGGVGLNLTGADTVIHFDPWWNPAVEAQATDRAHRIGQKRVVTSYKLISRGTVEEKILQLQTAKEARTEATLSGEGELAQTLSWDEIQGLLS